MSNKGDEDSEKEEEEVSTAPAAKAQPNLSFAKSRIKRIMRLAEPEKHTISTESALLVGKAAEMFVKLLAQESKRMADKDGRKTIRPNDIYECILQNKMQFGFLEDVFGPQKIAAVDEDLVEEPVEL